MARTKAGRARSPSQLDRDRRRISRLYLRGFYQRDIAKKMGLGRATVSRDLTYLRKQWVEASQVDAGLLLGRELARLQLVEAEAWGAWDRSMVLRGRGGEPLIGEHGEEVMVPGDPAWLDRIMRCIERRCKLLGLGVPERLQLSGGLEMGGSAPLLSVDERREALKALVGDVLGLFGADGDNGDGRGPAEGVGPLA